MTSHARSNSKHIMHNIPYITILNLYATNPTQNFHSTWEISARRGGTMRKTALCVFMLLVALSGKQPPSHLMRAADGFTGGISNLLSGDSPPFLPPKVGALWFWRKTPHEVRTGAITNQSYCRVLVYEVTAFTLSPPFRPVQERVIICLLQHVNQQLKLSPLGCKVERDISQSLFLSSNAMDMLF